MNASSKEIVTSIMKFEGTEDRTFTNRSGKTVTKKYLLYRCPKPSCNVKLISFQANSGFRNPCDHLKACYAKNQSPDKQEEIL